MMLLGSGILPLTVLYCCKNSAVAGSDEMIDVKPPYDNDNYYMMADVLMQCVQDVGYKWLKDKKKIITIYLCTSK